MAASVASMPIDAVAATKALTPAQLQDEVVAAMRSQAGVVTTVTDRLGAKLEDMVTRSGIATGTQSITLNGLGPTETVNIVLSGGVVFIRGNEAGLNTYMGFTAQAAKELAGEWLRVGSAEGEPHAELSLFTNASADLTISTLVLDTVLPEPLSFTRPALIDGQQVTGIAATIRQADEPTVHAVLYVRASGNPLPVEEVEAVKGGTSTAVFSNWGKAPMLNVPDNAVPFQPWWLPANY